MVTIDGDWKGVFNSKGFSDEVAMTSCAVLDRGGRTIGKSVEHLCVVYVV